MKNKVFNIKNVYLGIVLFFAIPSIYKMLFSGFVVEGKEYFSFLLQPVFSESEKIFGTIVHALFFLILFGLYFFLIKKREIYFKSVKKIVIFALLSSICFALILPVTSSDVYSYATTGEIQSKYGANPYYDTIAKIKSSENTENNEILNSISIWDNQLVIYGPLWTLICGFVTLLSFSKISMALSIFKILAIIVHVVNVILIYKICKKSIWAVVYGLNPYIMFEFISNAHNDIYLVFFTVFAIYFLKNKKNLLLALIFMALATCVKYVTVLLVPIILIYYYRNELIFNRIIKCIKMGLVFSFFVLIMYLVYIRDINSIFYVFIQQGKNRESIFAFIIVLALKFDLTLILENVKLLVNTVSFICFILYGDYIIRLLLRKNISFKNIMQGYEIILLIFIFGVISNLCVWYLLWLFIPLIWIRSKNVRFILYLPMIYELLISIYYFYNDEIVKNTAYFSLVVLIGAFVISRLDQKFKFGLKLQRLENKLNLCINK